MSKLSHGVPPQFVNGRWCYGAAAQQHIIKKNGGFRKFTEEIAVRAASNAVRETLEQVERELMQEPLKLVIGSEEPIKRKAVKIKVVKNRKK